MHQLLKDYADWCNSDPAHYVDFVLVTAEITRNQLVRYTTDRMLIDTSHVMLTNLDVTGKKFRPPTSSPEMVCSCYRTGRGASVTSRSLSTASTLTN